MENDKNKEIIDELVAQRDRTGKEPLTIIERTAMLNDIYDGLLIFWKQLVVMGSAKGTGAIALQLERARLELESWGSIASTIHGAQRKALGWDYSNGEKEDEDVVSDA